MVLMASLGCVHTVDEEVCVCVCVHISQFLNAVLFKTFSKKKEQVQDAVFLK